MKLNFDQLQVMKDGARIAEERYLSNAKVAANEEVRAYWAAEAETARQIAHILADALSIEVESVHLTPATEGHPATSQAPAACPPSQSAESPATSAGKQAAAEPDEQWRSLHTQVRHALAQGCPNASLEGWDDAGPASGASVANGLEPPPEVLRLLDFPALPSPSPRGSTPESAGAETPPAPPMSSSVNSSPEPTWDDAGINPDTPIPFEVL